MALSRKSSLFNIGKQEKGELYASKNMNRLLDRLSTCKLGKPSKSELFNELNRLSFKSRLTKLLKPFVQCSSKTDILLAQSLSDSTLVIEAN